MKLFSILLAAALPFATVAQSCSFSGAEPFQPDVEGWRPFGPDGDYLGVIPAPKVVLRKAERGKEAPGASCADAGTLLLSVSLPRKTKYKISDLGVYFRVVGGEDFYGIFPVAPLAGKVTGRGYDILLPWLDGHPSDHLPIKLNVEVFFVSKALQIGESKVVSIALG